MNIKSTKILIFALVSLFCLSVLYLNLNKDIEKQQTRQQIINDEYYTVKDYNGKIAVFKNSENIPITVYDSYTSLLPEYDKKLLKEGIRVKDTNELQKIIEDYTS